jgi:hypothetical protein
LPSASGSVIPASLLLSDSAMPDILLAGWQTVKRRTEEIYKDGHLQDLKF